MGRGAGLRLSCGESVRGMTVFVTHTHTPVGYNSWILGYSAHVWPQVHRLEEELDPGHVRVGLAVSHPGVGFPFPQWNLESRTSELGGTLKLDERCKPFISQTKSLRPQGSTPFLGLVRGT